MKHFWENSPEWQRKQAAWAAVLESRAKVDEAADDLLTKIRCYGPQPSTIEDEARTRYFEAAEECHAVLSAWTKASQAFKASPAGQARDRFLKDPFAPAALAEQEVS